MRFVYSVVRFVPDPARGEFVNVGAIVGSEESSEWDIRQIENPVRARALGATHSLDAVWSFIDRIGHEIDQNQANLESLFATDEELSEDWLEQLHRDHQNVVQLSPPTPVVADSAEEALDRVFNLLIVDPAQRQFAFRKKNEALAALRRAYAAQSIRKNLDLRERVVLTTLHHNERFDFAVTNGRTLQLTHAWSFQVPDQESLSEQIKAWGWTVNDARANGGHITTPDGHTFEVKRNVDIQVVYVPPRPDDDAPALNDARNVFAELEITAVPIDQADDVAAHAHALVVAAGVGRINYA